MLLYNQIATQFIMVMVKFYGIDKPLKDKADASLSLDIVCVDHLQLHHLDQTFLKLITAWATLPTFTTYIFLWKQAKLSKLRYSDISQ